MIDLRSPDCPSPYALERGAKRALYRDWLTERTAWHRAHCPAYAAFLSLLDCGEGPFEPEEVPFLPVSALKELRLQSVPEEAVFKTLTSSGTGGQRPSVIVLDRETSRNQQLALAQIMGEFLGPKRLPMLVLDTAVILRDRQRFSARAAGVAGFSIFSSGICYALDENMELDTEDITRFCQAHGREPVLVFGFTYIIWQRVLEALERSGLQFDLPEGILIHGGGWKKLADRAVSGDVFRKTVMERLGIRRVHEYYGMAEQTGSIFMECECGHLHASLWSELLIRSPRDFSVCGAGETGLIQVLSPLPGSYPGHSLLTEDLGLLLGEDDCPCGRKGKYFKVLGRVPKAEVRGCGDTYEG